MIDWLTFYFIFYAMLCSIRSLTRQIRENIGPDLQITMPVTSQTLLARCPPSGWDQALDLLSHTLQLPSEIHDCGSSGISLLNGVKAHLNWVCHERSTKSKYGEQTSINLKMPTANGALLWPST